MYDLVIVESGTKAPQVQSYLDSLFGKGKYKVSHSKGHIRDLPTESLGLNDQYQPTYVLNDSGVQRV
ncbi:toprim domain-containing protein, partial [Acinetobacter baumannii]|nr:toprim domain-containing protein [Acinetobacter baumannii]